MICRRCAHAADHRLPRAMHCDSRGGPGADCDCQHQPSQRPAASPRRGPALRAVTTGLLAVLLLVLTGCAEQPPPAPPRGATGKVVDKRHETKYGTRTVPRTTQSCRTDRKGRRTCRQITVGTRTVRELVRECWEIQLDSGDEHCVSRALYDHTKIGDTW